MESIGEPTQVKLTASEKETTLMDTTEPKTIKSIDILENDSDAEN